MRRAQFRNEMGAGAAVRDWRGRGRKILLVYDNSEKTNEQAAH